MAAAHFLRILGGGRQRLGDAVAVGAESELDGADLGADRIKRSVEQLEAHLARHGGLTRGRNKVADKLAADAKAGLERLAGEGAAATLTPAMEIGLEAIILADGSRPSILVQDDRVDPEDEELGDWAAAAATFRPDIATIAPSVGRIELAPRRGSPVGTGFVVRPGIVATNRHVLQEIAVPDSPEPAGWRLVDGAQIDFGGEHSRPDRPERRFALERVLFAGPEQIGETAEPGKLDIALLVLAEVVGRAFPAPLTLAKDAGEPRSGDRVHMIGFPAKPAPGIETGAVLRKLYAKTYGCKRWSPGEVLLGPGKHERDAAHAWTFTHDASALGGNSGSCLARLSGDGRTLVGVHFGGERRVENFAHAVSRILGELPI